MGIAPILVERIYETIAEINQQGTTILLVEQNANFALERVEARLRARDRARSRWPTSPRRCATTPRSRGRTWAHEPSSSRSSARRPCSCLYAWLASAIIASYLSDRKGYGEKPGLGDRPAAERRRRDHLAARAGPRADSRWKLQGPFGSGGGKTVAEARAEREAEES